MTTEYKLNQLIEWTEEDRAKGECPVPDGSVVTLWYGNGKAEPNTQAKFWYWGKTVPKSSITAYLIHSVPREPIVRHLFIDEFGFELLFSEKSVADDLAKENGGRVVKMMEVME
jgi:hypothetical protein